MGSEITAGIRENVGLLDVEAAPAPAAELDPAAGAVVVVPAAAPEARELPLDAAEEAMEAAPPMIEVMPLLITAV